MSPALKDNISKGVRWHLSRRQTYRFPIVTYQHIGKHRQTSTTANKDKFFYLHQQNLTVRQWSLTWAVFLFSINLCSTLSHRLHEHTWSICRIRMWFLKIEKDGRIWIWRIFVQIIYKFWFVNWLLKACTLQHWCCTLCYKLTVRYLTKWNALNAN